MILRVAKHQGYSIYHFGVVKGKLPPPPTRLELRKPLGESRPLHCHCWEIPSVLSTFQKN